MNERRWFTSDLHFGHRNVITYCNRPYQDVQEMNEKIILQWNKQVAPNDIVYVLGDFSLHPRYSKEILPRLFGSKVLVMGNHDAPFPMARNKRAERMKEVYIQDGWNDVLLYHKLILNNNQEVLLAHMPYANEASLSYDKRYIDFRPKDEGLVLLHGHLHCKYRKNGRMIDVGFDGDLKLWSEDEIISIITDSREVIETPITQFYKTRQENTPG